MDKYEMDKDNQGGFIVPKLYFDPKRGWFWYLCRRLGKWLFFLGHDELHPYEALINTMKNMEITRK